MKLHLAGPALAFAGLLASATPALSQDAHLVTAAEIQAKVATLKDGVANPFLPTAPGSLFLAVRRDRTGDAEVHAKHHDQFVAQQGRAKVIVGGTLAGQRQTAEGEWRGGQITGGRTYDLAPGDTLFIPAGQPHQVLVPAGGDFLYLVAKFDAK